MVKKSESIIKAPAKKTKKKSFCLDKKIKTLVIWATAIGIIFSAYIAFDKTYARDKRADEILVFAQATAKQLQIKIENDVLTNKQQRYNTFMDRYGPYGERAPNPIIKEQTIQMKKDVEVQERKVNTMENAK